MTKKERTGHASSVVATWSMVSGPCWWRGTSKLITNSLGGDEKEEDEEELPTKPPEKTNYCEQATDATKCRSASKVDASSRPVGLDAPEQRN